MMDSCDFTGTRSSLLRYLGFSLAAVLVALWGSVGSVGAIPHDYDGGLFTYDEPVDVAAGLTVEPPGTVAAAVEVPSLATRGDRSFGRTYDLSSFFVAPNGLADDLYSVACRSNSFVPGTLVLMADGTTMAIEEIEIGDWVWATDLESGEAGPRRVIDTIVGDGRKDLVDIDVVGDTVTATDGHPFWVADDGAWIDAGDLEVGDRLLLANGHTTPITAIDERVAVQRVHNLTVDGIHTYYVQAGDEHVLVHNTGCTNIADLPDAAVRNLTTDETFAFQHLRDNHGLTRIEFREQIHAIKQAEGLPADFDVFFGPTGDVWNPSSGDLIGRLVHGG